MSTSRHLQSAGLARLIVLVLGVTGQCRTTSSEQGFGGSVGKSLTARAIGLSASVQFESKKWGEGEEDVLVQGDIVINRPTDEVFDFVADERNEPKYNPQMTLAEMVTHGPIGVGSKFHCVMTGARAADMTIEVTEFDRPRRFGSTTHLSNMDIDGTLLFEPQGQSTKMKWLWNIEPRGLLRLLGPIVRRIGERQELSNWTGLKRVLEAQSQPSR